MLLSILRHPMADANTELHEILYCSELSAGLPTTVVASIIGQARAANAKRGITGLLVFDGHRFCQHLEGPHNVTIRLMDRIARDERHTHVRVIHEGRIPQRRYLSFELGLADSEADLADLQKLDGVQALARFLEMRRGFDIS